MLSIASFLDPRFRSLSYLSEEDRKVVIKSVEEEAFAISSIDTEDASSSLEEPPTKKQRGENMLLTIMSDIIQPASKW